MNRPQAEEYFQKYYDELIRQAINARAHLKLWESLEKYKPSYLKELNQAPHFFTFTNKAHLDVALLTLSRILDPHEESLNIWKFLNFAEQNREIFCTQAFQQRIMHKPNYSEYWVKSHTPIKLKEIQEHRQELEHLGDIIKNIQGWRGKALAHIDRKFHLTEIKVSKRYPLQLQQLQEIIERIAQILNRYSVAYDASSSSIWIDGEDDIQIVMDSIRAAVQERKNRIEEFRRQARDKE